MALTRVWIPSPCYSSRGGSSVRLIVLHTSEGAQDYQSLGNFFGNSANQVSSHIGADNKVRGKVGEYVSRGNKAWTQGNANPVCVSCELCTPSGAAAGWSRDYWLNNQSTMLHNAADWVREEASKYGIPIKALSSSQAQGGSAGVCDHVDLGSWGGGHSDCGPGFPMDKIIEWASGSTPAPQSGGFYMSSSMAVDASGKRHYAAIWDEPDHKVNYKAPGGSWVAVDPGSSARSGCDIAIVNEKVYITYTNTSGQVCTYDKPVNGGKWTWTGNGPSGGKVMLSRYKVAAIMADSLDYQDIDSGQL